MEQLEFEKDIKIDDKDALIIVDIQNDFLPGGSLPVEEWDLIIDGINVVAEIFKDSNSLVVLTQN